MAGDVTPIDVLFEEFLAAWTRNESLDTEGLLKRAGPQADQLGRLIDAFMQRAPRRPPSPEARDAVAELAAGVKHDPPLLDARVSARLRVSDVTQALLAGCGLPAEAERLVRSYYQRLEGGLLDPAGVSDRVWALLDKVIGGARQLAVDGFRGGETPGPTAGLVFQRLAGSRPSASSPPAADAGPAVPNAVRTQVDDLFTGEAVD